MIYGDSMSDSPEATAILQSSNLYLYCMQNPILYVDLDGNAGKRFHSQAKQYMKGYMPIEDAVNTMFTPDTMIVPAVVDKNGNIIVPEREVPLIIYGGSVSKFGKALGASLEVKSVDYKFPKSNTDMKKIFNVNDKVFHKEIKPEILKQIKQDPKYGREFKKMGSNPDIGVDRAGNIVLKDVKTGKTLQTNWAFESFRP